MKLNEILLECLGIPFENKCNIIIINSNGEEINVDCEIPTTPEEKSQVLMYRDELGENNGMFYDYIDNGFFFFFVEIPLEMIFINDNEISEIKKARPFDRTNISPVLPADSNLEVNQGFCNNNNIQVGDKIYKS